MNEFQKNIKDIVTDREHGSSELVNKIIAEFRAYKSRLTQKELDWAFKQLKNIDPSMVIVHHFLAEMHYKDKADFYQHLDQYVDQWNDVNDQIAERFKKFVGGGKIKVLTHSRSGTILSLLIACRKKVLKVIQTESVPGKEGLKQAKSLRENDLDVKLIKDDQASMFLGISDLVLIGCDQYNDKTFVNKCGTASILHSAIRQAIPVYLITDSRKKVEHASPEGEIFEYVPFQQGITLITESSIQHLK